MADAMKISPNNTIPTLPPLPGAAPLVHSPRAGHGQIWPLTNAGKAATAATTPQPQQHQTRTSPLNRRGE
jgi:hypothetical protein